MQKYFYISVLLFIFSIYNVVGGVSDYKASFDQGTFALSSEEGIFRSVASKNNNTYLAAYYKTTKGFATIQKKGVSESMNMRYSQAMYSPLFLFGSDHPVLMEQEKNKCNKAHKEHRQEQRSKQVKYVGH